MAPTDATTGAQLYRLARPALQDQELACAAGVRVPRDRAKQSYLANARFARDEQQLASARRGVGEPALHEGEESVPADQNRCTGSRPRTGTAPPPPYAEGVHVEHAWLDRPAHRGRCRGRLRAVPLRAEDDRQFGQAAQTSPSPWPQRSADRGTASRMVGKRPCRVVNAITPSSRASRAPGSGECRGRRPGGGCRPG